MRDDGDCLPPEWERAVAGLRAEPPVRAAWRDEVLRAVRAAPQPVARAHGARSRVLRVALAAAVTGFVLGAGAMRLAGRAERAPVREAVREAVLEARVPAAAEQGMHAAASDAGAPTLVRFVVLARDARRVSLVGEFNGWDPAAMPMRRAADGTWWLEARLVPGRHRYAFLVDGRLVTDPGAPVARDDDFGVRSSVILVTRPST